MILKKIVNLLRKKQGYVSLEMVIIGGLIVGLGAGVIGNLSENGSKQVQNSVNVLENNFTEDSFPGLLK